MMQREAVFPWNMHNLTTLHTKCQYFFIESEYLFGTDYRNC